MIKGLVAGAANIAGSHWLGNSLPPVGVSLLAGLLGFFAIGVSLVLFVLALRYLGTARTGAYFSLAPFIGALIALGLGEPLTPQFPLISALFDASSASHNYICTQAMSAKQYQRVQVNLAKSIALDATDPASLAALEKAVDDIPADVWRDTVAWVKKHFG